MSWEPGTLVECVDDVVHVGWTYFGGPNGHGLDGLSRGRVYRIRSVFIDPANHTCLRLDEILRRVQVDGRESGYHTARFRPLTDTRLAIFRKLLAPIPTKEREPA